MQDKLVDKSKPVIEPKPSQDVVTDKNQVQPEKPKPKSKKRSRELIRTKRKDKSVVDKVSSLAIPIVVLVVLAIIIMVVVVPFGTEIMDTYDETKIVQSEIEVREGKYDSLKKVEMGVLENTLDIVESVVRDDMDVAELANEVEKVALANNLEPKEMSMSDIASTLLQTPDESVSISTVSDSISGPFSFFGNFSDMTGFLYDLRNNSSTVLALDTLYVSRYRVDDENSNDSEILWSADILITGFTTEPVKKTVLNSPIDTSIDEDLVDEISGRSPLSTSRNNDNE